MKNFSLPTNATKVVVKSITNGTFAFANDLNNQLPQKMDFDYDLPINKKGEVDYSAFVNFPSNIQKFDGKIQDANFKPSDFGTVNGKNVEIPMYITEANGAIEIDIDGNIQTITALP